MGKVYDIHLFNTTRKIAETFSYLVGDENKSEEDIKEFAMKRFCREHRCKRETTIITILKKQ